MVLVIAAAFFVALLFVLFKAFERFHVALLPAIVINYVVALVCGLLVSRPWEATDLSPLWLPAFALSFVFIGVFLVTGISTRQAGVAPTTVASKTSLVITVAAAVWLYDEHPGAVGWSGIALAVMGVVLASWSAEGDGPRPPLSLPILLFFGNAVIDIALNRAQRTVLVADTEAAFPALIFGFTSILGIVLLLVKGELRSLRDGKVLLGGVLLGSINYGSLYFVVKALSSSGLPASSVFPLMNIGVILFGTAISMVFFRERLKVVHWAGIGVSVLAMVLILSAQA